MRTFTLILTMFFAGSSLFAQETPDEKKTKGVSPEVKEKVNKAKDRILLEFTLQQLTNKPADLKISGFSRGFNAYFLYDVVISNSRFSVAPGAGIGTDNFYHKNNAIQWRGDSATSFPKIADSLEAKKSKLGLAYFDIPLELRFRSRPNGKNTSWKLAAGFRVGFLLASKWKYKGEALDGGGDDVKFKEFGVDNLQKIRYGVYLRGGYGMFNLFCHYSISSLFEQDKGPQMHPITFGLAITGL